MTIRDYHVIRQLGEGGMGTVYLVEEPLLDRKVAVKVLNPELMANQELVERFRQEAKVQSGLVHPGIVQLYTFFKEDGKYCMVMEYVEGETLRALIERTGPLGEARSLKIFGEVLEAVQYAHGRGVIHRDLKPSNIMISDGMTAKVMDFGIAKVLGDHGLTHTGTRMGTVYYMSPEQVLAEKTIDQRTDFYSLGITLYEMLTGKLPYNIDTESEFKIMQQIVEGKIPDPRELYPHISDKTVQLLLGCIAKKKEDRFISDGSKKSGAPLKAVPVKKPVRKVRRRFTVVQEPLNPLVASEILPERARRPRLIAKDTPFGPTLLSAPRKGHDATGDDSEEEGMFSVDFWMIALIITWVLFSIFDIFVR
jgi:serine/threonine protein kinase